MLLLHRLLAVATCIACCAGPVAAAELVFEDTSKREFKTDAEFARSLRSPAYSQRSAALPYHGYEARLSADGKVAALYNGKRVHLVELQPLRLITAFSTQRLKVFELSGDGKWLLTSPEERGDMQLRHIGRSNAPVSARANHAMYGAISHDGSRVLAVGSSGPRRARVYVREGKHLRKLAPFGSKVTGVDLAADGRRAVLGVWKSEKVVVPTVWEVPDTGAPRRMAELGGTGTPHISPDGKLVSVGGALWRWSRANGGAYSRQRETFSPILALGNDTVVHGWESRVSSKNLLTGAERLMKLTANHHSAAVSADGRWILSGDQYSSVRLWDGSTKATTRYQVAGVPIDWSPSPDRGSVASLVVEDWPEVEPELAARWRVEGTDQAFLDVRLSVAGEESLYRSAVDVAVDIPKVLPGDELERRLHFGRVQPGQPATRSIRVALDERLLAGPVRTMIRLRHAGRAGAALAFERELAPGDRRAGDKLIQLRIAWELRTARRFEEALRWFTRSAEAGHHLAMLGLARAIVRGQGTERDYGRALHWALRAVGGKSVIRGEAEELAGFLLLHGGHGLQADPAAAARWFRKSRLSGGSYFLGKMHREGRGVARDLGEAVRLLEDSAQHGNVAANRELARLLWMGTGVPRDLARARKLLTAAGKQDKKAKALLAELEATVKLPRFRDDRAFASALHSDTRLQSAMVGDTLLDWRKLGPARDVTIREAWWDVDRRLLAGDHATLVVRVANTGREDAGRVTVQLGTRPGAGRGLTVHIGLVPAGGEATRRVSVPMTARRLEEYLWRVDLKSRSGYAWTQALPRPRPSLEVGFELRSGRLRALIRNRSPHELRDLELQLNVATREHPETITRQALSRRIDSGGTHSLEASLTGSTPRAVARIRVTSKRLGVLMDESVTISPGDGVVRRSTRSVRELRSLAATPIGGGAP